MSPEVFSAVMFGWAMTGLPITIVISLWAIYRVILGGKLSFGEWAYKMINRKSYISGRVIVRFSFPETEHLL